MVLAQSLSLFLRDAIVAHALARFRQLPQGILPRKVPSTQHARSNGEVGPVTTKPTARCSYHSASGDVRLHPGLRCEARGWAMERARY